MSLLDRSRRGNEALIVAGSRGLEVRALLPGRLQCGIVKLFVLCPFVAVSLAGETRLARSEWGAPAVSVSHAGDVWTIAGQKYKALLNQNDLKLTIQTPATNWT